jgi:L-fuconolactonase
MTGSTQTSTYKGIFVRSNLELETWFAQASRETAIEADLPIVDTHHHLWDDSRGRFLLPELLADIDESGHRIVAGVFVECRSGYRVDGPPQLAAVGEVALALREGEASDRRTGGQPRIAEAIVAYADLAIGEGAKDVLEAELAAAHGRLRGIRYPLTWDSDAAISPYLSRGVPPRQALQEKFREGLAQLAPLGLHFECWHYHPQLNDAVNLARAFPETTIVVNHTGGALGVGGYSTQREEVFRDWKRSIEALAQCENVQMKLGGLGMTCFGFGFHERERPPTSRELARSWHPYVTTCIEAFGPSRCMFESNWPPDKQSCGYAELWNAFKVITASASAGERAELYAGTAARVYRIDVPELASVAVQGVE